MFRNLISQALLSISNLTHELSSSRTRGSKVSCFPLDPRVREDDTEKGCVIINLNVYMFQHILQKGVILVSLFLVSCLPQSTTLRFSQPAEISTFGIQRVAVARFQVIEIKRTTSIERSGNWEEHSPAFSPELKNEIAKQVRGKVINLLSTSPSFKLVYADEFEKLENDASIQQLIASEGFRAQQVDAIINGNIWIDVNNYDGSELDKLTLKYARGGKNAPAYSIDALLYWPYKSIKGSLTLEVKLTRLDPSEIIATAIEIRNFGEKIGGRPPNFLEKIKEASGLVTSLVLSQNKKEEELTEGQELEESNIVLSSFVQSIGDMAESVAAQFVKKIAVREKEVSVTIASGGDSSAVDLIKSGAFEKAITRLNVISANNNPDDKYNLGLCYEAIGEYGLANVAYEEAFTIEPNLTYAKGMGRVEQLQQEFRQVRAQLSSKQN